MRVTIVHHHHRPMTSVNPFVTSSPSIIIPTMPQSVSLKPGDRVRVVQQIAARHYTLATPVEGTVVRLERKPTGSWYAHGARNKFWLDRIVLKKDDGEISTLNLDSFSHVEVI